MFDQRNLSLTINQQLEGISLLVFLLKFQRMCESWKQLLSRRSLLNLLKYWLNQLNKA
jgi:hypothetical protein